MSKLHATELLTGKYLKCKEISCLNRVRVFAFGSKFASHKLAATKMAEETSE